MIGIEEIDTILIEDVSEELGITNEVVNIKDKAYISGDILLYYLDELFDKYKSLESEFEEYKDNINENYQPKKFDPYNYYGVSRSDF